jgi:hypothetical protein
LSVALRVNRGVTLAAPLSIGLGAESAESAESADDDRRVACTGGGRKNRCRRRAQSQHPRCRCVRAGRSHRTHHPSSGPALRSIGHGGNSASPGQWNRAAESVIHLEPSPIPSVAQSCSGDLAPTLARCSGECGRHLDGPRRGKTRGWHRAPLGCSRPVSRPRRCPGTRAHVARQRCCRGLLERGARRRGHGGGDRRALPPEPEGEAARDGARGRHPCL